MNDSSKILVENRGVSAPKWLRGMFVAVLGMMLAVSISACGGGPPKALKQPLPATEQEARTELESLLKFSAQSTADPVAGPRWLTWRVQTHTPALGWAYYRMRLDWPVNVAFKSAGRNGWRVEISLVGGEGIDPVDTVPAADAEPIGTGPVYTPLTRAEFIVPTATEAGRLRSAWLRIAGGPVVPDVK